MYDLIVIGGGVAGLTAAAFSARAGAHTLLLEASSTLGGRAKTRDVGGYRFNVGPHALYLGGAAMRTLGELGIDPLGAPPAGNGSWYVLADQLHSMSMLPAEVATSTMFQNEDKQELGRAFQAIGAGFRGEPGDTVAAALQRLTRSESVRAVMAAQIRVATYSNAPELADASAAFDQLRLAFSGVRYLDGGWQTMVDALAVRAQSAGAEIRPGQRASAVARQGSGWRVACAGGATLDAPAVILATDPRQARELTDRTWVQSPAPAQAASLDVGLARLPRPECTFALGIDEPTYFSVHSVTAQQLAPSGGAMLHVSRYLEPGERSSTAIRLRLEALLDLLQPGWRDLVVQVQWLPRVNVTHDQPQAGLGGLAGRAPVAAAPGLFLAGDWIGDEGMLVDAAFASGRRAGIMACADALSGQHAV